MEGGLGRGGACTVEVTDQRAAAVLCFPLLPLQKELSEGLTVATEFHSTSQELLKGVGALEEALGGLPPPSFVLATVTHQIQEQKVSLRAPSARVGLLAHCWVLGEQMLGGVHWQPAHDGLGLSCPVVAHPEQLCVRAENPCLWMLVPGAAAGPSLVSCLTLNALGHGKGGCSKLLRAPGLVSCGPIGRPC